MQVLRIRLIVLTIIAGAMASTVPAAAQDGYAPPPPGYYAGLWQGWYAGVHLGYGESGPADGFLGGVQAGYNWQKGALVYGLEADVSWADIGFSERVSACVDADCVTARVSGSIDWTATLRGRLGYLFQPGLLGYATAGFGLVSGSASTSVSGFGLSERFSFDDTEADFVYGVGIEGRLGPGSTWRVEYIGFSDAELDVVRAALSFKLGY
jgi:outer membrane immunogenic protein